MSKMTESGKLERKTCDSAGNEARVEREAEADEEEIKNSEERARKR